MTSDGPRGGLWCAICLVVLLSGCSNVIRAQVIDAETKRPIPGAVVVGVWMTVVGLPGMTHHQTVGVRETETDADGRFDLERLPSSGLDGEGDGDPWRSSTTGSVYRI